jgi:glutathione synthase
VDALKIGVVMDPIEKIDIDKDTTFVMMLEAQHRGHEIDYMELQDLAIRHTTPQARFRRIHLTRGTPHYRFVSGASSGPVGEFDVILMRKDPPFDLAYFFATHLLSLVDGQRCLVVNGPRGLREAPEKLFALNFPDLIPPTLVTSDVKLLKAFMEEQGGEMIVKPLEGFAGSSVFYIHRADKNTNAILEMMTSEGRRATMAQRYLPAIRKGDKRIIVLDGEPIGAVLRVPREDEHRGNIHVGGRCVKTDLTPRDLEICRVMAPHLQRLGLYFVGIDVIGDYLTEVNVTSPTGVQEINGLDGVRLERQIVDFIEQKAVERSRSRIQP